MPNPVTHISTSINRPVSDVYDFASNPENFPRWVAFVRTMTKQGDVWHATTDIGDIQIKWPPKNDFGIMDHAVTLETGETVMNPMRVAPNGDGCELIFTLFRMPGRSDKEFQDDAAAVTADLKKLKEIMER